MAKSRGYTFEEYLRKFAPEFILDEEEQQFIRTIHEQKILAKAIQQVASYRSKEPGHVD